MATYPSAALQLQMPHIESPLDAYSKVLAIRQMKQQSQMQDLQLQQQQRAIKDQETIQNVLGQTGGDWDKAMPILAKSISPKTFVTMQNERLSWNKASLEEKKARIETLMKQSERMGQLAGMVTDEPTKLAAVKQAVAEGLLDEAGAQEYAQRPYDPSWVKGLQQQALTVQQQLAEGWKKLENDRAQQKASDEHTAALTQLPGQQAKSAQDQMAFIAQTMGPARSQKEWAARRAFIAAKLPADLVGQIPEQFSPEAVQGVKALGLSPEKAASLSDVNQYINNWLAQRNLPNTPANWSTAHRAYTNETKVQPGVMRMEVLANTRPVQIVDPNNPDQVIYASAGQAIRAGAASPQSIQFQTDKGVQRAFTTGRPAEELAAFNTAIQHADLFQQAAQAMQNGDVRALNTLRNKFKTEFGSPTITNFQSIANAYSREVTKALSAGHITDNEIREQSATIPANASPAQILGAINAYKGLMQSKVNIRRQQYEAGRQGKPNFGGQDGAVQVTDPRGVVHTFPNQAAADYFKKLAGLK